MTLGFGSAIGNFFNILGKCGAVVGVIDTAQTDLLADLTGTTDGLTAQLAVEPDLQSYVGGSYVSNLNSLASVCGQMKQVAVQAVNRLVFRDNPRPGQTLTQYNTLSSLAELIRQMKAGGVTVLAATVAGTTSAFTGEGDGVVNFSARRPVDCLTLENTFAETVRAVCTADSYTGGATAFNETVLFYGEGAQSNVFAFDWPLGSGASVAAQAIDGDSDNASGNLLTNSGFETFTSNFPDNWTRVTGAASVVFFEENTLVFDPTLEGNALRILGDGSTLANLYQAFGDSEDGTAGELEPVTQYSFNVYMRRDGGGSVAAGVLEVALVDSDDNYIQDESGANNAFTFDLTTLTTFYAAYKGVFRTPNVMPSSYRLRLRLTTAVTSGRSVYLDKASLGQMFQLYTGGPYLAVHSGSVPFEAGDQATVEVTNSRGAGGTLNTFQTVFQRLFYDEVMRYELLLPSSSVPFVSDALIS